MTGKQPDNTQADFHNISNVSVIELQTDCKITFRMQAI